MKYISIIDNNLKGHIFRDDEYHLNIMARTEKNIEIYLHNEPHKILKEKYKTSGNLAFLNQIESKKFISKLIFFYNLKVNKNETVIFNGFSELDLLLFCSLNYFSKPKLTLLPTNNFSLLRFNKYKIFLPLIYFLIGPFLRKVVFGSEGERSFFHKKLPFLKNIIFLNRNVYQIVKDNRKIGSKIKLTESNHALNLLFVGPVKADKPLKPIIDMIAEFRGEVFDFYFLHLDNELELIKRKFPQLKNLHSCTPLLSSYKNNEKIDNEAYLSIISSCDLIFLNHDRNFQYKLSGVLMDALACGVPFITNNIKPATEYLDKFQDLGIIVDFSDPEWPISLREKINLFKFNEFRVSSEAFHREYNDEYVLNSMIKILED
tara:strand:+ start:4225 stop:5349 length:1125 start_codon:yes stop_codon:yes gene_type:complete